MVEGSNPSTSTSFFPAEEILRYMCSEGRCWRDSVGGVDRRGQHEAGLGHDIGYFLCAVFYRST